jgi:hypothetical protein
MSRLTRLYKLPLICAGIVALSWGCGESPPLSVSEVSQPALTKPTNTVSGSVAESVSKKILDTDGGRLKLDFDRPSEFSVVSVLRAQLDIPENALGSSGKVYRISMSVSSGNTLDDIDVAFTPSGLSFTPEAKLTLVIIGPVSAEDIESATHIFGDGQIESVETTAVDRKRKTRVVIVVPGFSRYGFDDDGAMSEETEF